MALPGLLIEYLVSGAVALLWAAPLFFAVADPVALKESVFAEFGGAIFSAVILIPACYCLGMVVNVLAYAITSRLPSRAWSAKRLVRRLVNRRVGAQAQDNPFADDMIAADPIADGGRKRRGVVWMRLNHPDLAEEVKQRSSRDRIARGMIVNALLTAIVGLSAPVAAAPIVSPAVAAGAAIVFAVTWAFFEQESYGFELRIGDLTREE